MTKKIFLYCLLPLPFLALCQEKEPIDQLLDDWHTAAATAQYQAYFDAMTADAVFIGTDATENWTRNEFEVFSKPYFDRGKAWSFTAIERNIYVDNSGKVAWFDELLDTRMKLCRGSGVVLKKDGKWKIAHYVLSIAVPNENVDALILLKQEKDSLLVHQLKNRN